MGKVAPTAIEIMAKNRLEVFLRVRTEFHDVSIDNVLPRSHAHWVYLAAQVLAK